MKSVKQRLVEAIENDIQSNFFMVTAEKQLIDLIKYLKTDYLPDNWEDNDYIIMAIKEFETLCIEFNV